MSSSMPFDEAAFAEWHKAQQQQVTDYLHKLAVFETDITGEWLWIIPHRGMLGRVWPKHGESPKLWIITGIVPTDHVEGGAAQTCRDAARYFALKWQMEAARLEHGDGNKPPPADAKIDWKDLRGNIARRAEWLFDLMVDDRRWSAGGKPLARIDHDAAQA
ncbi:MAG: DUF4826 family protein [Gammaproteobacteria bacterium]|nr:DUF4826 family protein [Gammaproteobacteria bacterium]